MGSDVVELRTQLPDMLQTQLLAANVYAAYLKYAQGPERAVWERMLEEELSHIRFVAMMMEAEDVPTLGVSGVRMGAFKEMAERAALAANGSSFERTLWALRLEHAEIDFGLESLSNTAVGETPDTPVCPGPMKTHYARLLRWANRDRAAREVAAQITRIEEHLPNLSNLETPHV